MGGQGCGQRDLQCLPSLVYICLVQYSFQDKKYQDQNKKKIFGPFISWEDYQCSLPLVPLKLTNAFHFHCILVHTKFFCFLRIALDLQISLAQSFPV